MWFFYFITKGISTHQKDVVCLEDFWQTFVLERKRERERERESERQTAYEGWGAGQSATVAP